MRSPGTGIAVLLTLGMAVGFGGGCGKEQDAGTGAGEKIAGMPEAEVSRAKQACDTYMERVCTCAQTHADMVTRCELAKASPGALQINLDLLASTGLEIVEQKAVKVEARKIAAACFESETKLDPIKCPRNTP